MWTFFCPGNGPTWIGFGSDATSLRDGSGQHYKGEGTATRQQKMPAVAFWAVRTEAESHCRAGSGLCNHSCNVFRHLNYCISPPSTLQWVYWSIHTKPHLSKRLPAAKAGSLELSASPEAETSSCCHIPHRGVRHSHFLFPKTVFTSFDAVKKKPKTNQNRSTAFPIWDAESLDQIITQGIWKIALSICSPGML